MQQSFYSHDYLRASQSSEANRRMAIVYLFKQVIFALFQALLLTQTIKLISVGALSYFLINLHGLSIMRALFIN